MPQAIDTWIPNTPPAGLSPLEQKIMDVGFSNLPKGADKLLNFKSALGVQEWLPQIYQQEQDLSQMYLNKIKSSPWLESLKRETKEKLKTDDIDYAINNMKMARDTAYPQMLRYLESQGTSIDPIKLMSLTNKVESFYDSQINSFLDVRKERAQSAEDWAKEKFESRTKDVELTKNALSEVRIRKADALDKVKDGVLDYKYLADIQRQEAAAARSYSMAMKNFEEQKRQFDLEFALKQQQSWATTTVRDAVNQYQTDWSSTNLAKNIMETEQYQKDKYDPNKFNTILTDVLEEVKNTDPNPKNTIIPAYQLTRQLLENRGKIPGETKNDVIKYVVWEMQNKWYAMETIDLARAIDKWKTNDPLYRDLLDIESQIGWWK